MVEIIRYSAAHKAAWDDFVLQSKNGTFLLLRDYMEYHEERFTDHSLLFFYKGKLLALLPANEAEGVLHSHAGLSYGGIISGRKMKTPQMLQLFEALLVYLKQQGLQKLQYKAIPAIYHQAPAEEDLYALFRSNGRLYRRDISSAIDLAQPLSYSKDRRWRLSQAKRNDLQIQLSDDYEAFMHLEQELLEHKYNTRPVHTAAEMLYLTRLFPENIRLFTVCKGGVMVAGCVVYETATVAHSQYMSATAAGREAGASDVLIDYLLKEAFAHKKFFSFGISTEQQGQHLNTGLIRYKESFGARAVVHDFYEIVL